MLEGMLDLTVFGVTGGEVRLAMVMVVDGGGKDGRGGDEGEGAVGGRQKVEMVDMHGYGNAVGRRISCGCVYTLPPLRISTPISPTPIPGVGSSRRGIRVHGPRLKHLYNYCWRDTIDGKATVFFICRCIREHGHGRSRGEAIGIKSAAGLGCLFIVHDDVVVFVDIVHDAGMWLER